MKKLILAYLCVYCNIIYSQVITEDFEDNDLSISPEWQGHTQDFITNVSGQLQLNMTSADTSSLSTPLELTPEMEWRFFIRLNFSPSSSNYSKMYLISDQQDLSSPLNGYYLRFGEAGSNDAIELFRQQGSSSTSVARSANGLISAAFTLNIKVVKDVNNNWKVYSSTGQVFQLIASGAGSSALTSGYFGLQCFYTSSNGSRFYFDDIYAGPVQYDTLKPELDSIRIINERSIELTFTEPLDTVRFKPSTFSIVGYPGIVTPAGHTSYPQKYHLTLSDSLADGKIYNLKIDSVYDLSGNTSDTIVEFTWFKPRRFDVIINEIMVDPTPSQGLPEHEFIELHNKTSHTVDLSGWTIKIGSGSKQITNASIPPHGFILLLSQTAASDFELLGNRCIIQALSSSALINTGTTMILSDKSAEVIDYMSYDVSTYKNELKSQGGYTLERIDPANNCGGRKNWTATLSNEGGTPGIPNSVTNPTAAVPFALENLCLADPNKLELTFSQFIDTTGISNTTTFHVDPSVGKISLTAGERFTDRIFIETGSSFSDIADYTLTIRDLNSCEGINVDVPAIQFSIGSPEQGNLVINEIMADPDPRKELPSIEYMEIINTSQKSLLTGGLKLSTNTGNGVVDCGIINPGEHVILCDVQQIETFRRYGKTIGVSGMPSLSNEGTTLSLSNASDVIISTITYTADWYKNQAKSEGGYSLEQIDPSNYCAGPVNWKATESVSGGTPGRRNSVYGQLADNKSPFIKYASIKDSTQVVITFSEPMKSNSLTLQTITIDNSIGRPLSISPSNKRLDTYTLSLASVLKRSIIYKISIDAGTDCAGNQLSGSTARIAYPEKAEEKDLLFNEIMFDAHTTDADYIEIYNQSSKPLSLSSILLTDLDTITNSLSSEKIIDTTGYIVFPSEYVCVTNLTEDLCSFSRCHVPAKILNSFEDLGLSAEGSIALVSVEGKIIDQLTYSESMQYPLLISTKGVSLEKVNPDLLSDQTGVWHSASSKSGWGTPGYKNSQLQELSDTMSFTVYPEVISPDNDGMNDVLNISFKDLAPGTLANVFIFSGTGVICKSLVENQLCGTSGVYVWDGTNDAGETGGQGIYIVYFETFDPLGTVKKQKKICVLHRGD